MAWQGRSNSVLHKAPQFLLQSICTTTVTCLVNLGHQKMHKLTTSDQGWKNLDF